MATVALERTSVPLWAAPVGLCLAMLSCSLAIAGMGGHQFWPPMPRYIEASLIMCASALAVWSVIQFVGLVREKSDNPSRVMWERLKPKLPRLALPAFILPLFLACYTAIKASLYSIVGFRYDALFASIDSAIFGQDPWRLTHALLSPNMGLALAIVYTAVWIAVLGYSKAFIAMFGSPRTIARFYIGMMLTWFVGGFFGAYLMSAAGPTFIEFNGLEWRFAELKLALLQTYGASSPFVETAGYLQSTLDTSATFDGGGISAMPSMHIAACSIYVFAAKGTRWFWPAVTFLGVIWFGSVYSGYHYAIDGPVAFLIALVCWKLAERFVEAYVID